MALDLIKVDYWLVPRSAPGEVEFLWFNDIYGDNDPEPSHRPRPKGIGYPGVWHDIDLSSIAPEGCKSVLASGLIVITAGKQQMQSYHPADMCIWFSRTGEEPNDGADDYQLQGITVNTGERQTFCVNIALDERRHCKFKWSRTGSGTYDAGPAYGLRVWVQMFGMQNPKLL